MKNITNVAEATSEIEELQFIEMTPACARDLTDRINKTSEDLAGMLQRAHDGKAWQALGYATWNDYVAGELKFSKQQSFRLLDMANIRKELAESPIGDSIPLPTKEAVTRELKKVDPAKRPKVYEVAVVANDGKEPTVKQIAEAVLEVMPPEAKSSEPKPESHQPSIKEMDKTAYLAIRSLGEKVMPLIKSADTLDECSTAQSYFDNCYAELKYFLRQVNTAKDRVVTRVRSEKRVEELKSLIGKKVESAHTTLIGKKDEIEGKEITLLKITGLKALIECEGKKLTRPVLDIQPIKEAGQ
ncbi:MAG: hypothetical protein WEB60_08280 [Terrimicrobiaceae bacterium]